MIFSIGLYFRKTDSALVLAVCIQTTRSVSGQFLMLQS